MMTAATTRVLRKKGRPFLVALLVNCFANEGTTLQWTLKHAILQTVWGDSEPHNLYEKVLRTFGSELSNSSKICRESQGLFRFRGESSQISSGLPHYKTQVQIAQISELPPRSRT